MITVLNTDGRELTPCTLDRAWREVNRSRAVWINEQTIQLLYKPFSVPEISEGRPKKRPLHLPVVRTACNNGGSSDPLQQGRFGSAAQPYCLLRRVQLKTGESPGVGVF